MFIIQQNDSGWVDISCHTLEQDADIQKVRFETSGISPENLQIVEKDLFEPALN